MAVRVNHLSPPAYKHRCQGKPVFDVSRENPAESILFFSTHRKWQQLLDKSTVHLIPRWILFVVLMVLYLIRVYIADGWFIVTYGLGIYLLNLFIGFLSPQVGGGQLVFVINRFSFQLDPDTEGPVLPTKESEEFRPFSRRVPEFKFW